MSPSLHVPVCSLQNKPDRQAANTLAQISAASGTPDWFTGYRHANLNWRNPLSATTPRNFREHEREAASSRRSIGQDLTGMRSAFILDHVHFRRNELSRLVHGHFADGGRHVGRVSPDCACTMKSALVIDQRSGSSSRTGEPDGKDIGAD
jgi:hypothetical protein